MRSRQLRSIGEAVSETIRQYILNQGRSLVSSPREAMSSFYAPFYKTYHRFETLTFHKQLFNDMKRSAVAVWNGTINDGHGHLNTQSGILEQAQYSFNSRFADGKGTNPEELIAAAHAGCFAMKLSLDLTDGGYEPDSLTVTSVVEIDGGVITSSHLTLTAVVPGLDQEKFAEFAKGAKENCPVSRALSIKISLDANLE